MHDLGIKIDTMDKLVEQRIVYLSDLWRREEFLTNKEIETIMKCKMENFDYIKLKRFCITKPNAAKIRREAENWERIFTTSVCDKGLISQIYREWSQMFKNKVIPQLINSQRI